MSFLKPKFLLLQAVVIVGLFQVSCSKIATGMPTTLSSTSRASIVNLRKITVSGLVWDNPGSLAWAPDGNSLLYTAFREAPISTSHKMPDMDIWQLALDGNSAKKIAADGHSPLFSSDGRKIYFSRFVPFPFSGLWAVDDTVGEPKQVFQSKGFMRIQQVQDGRLAIFEHVGTHSALRLYNPERNESTELKDLPLDIFLDEAQLSPDGTAIAYRDKNALVTVSNLDGSKRVTLFKGFCNQVWWSPDSRYMAYNDCSRHLGNLMIASRDGKEKITLFLPDNGYIKFLKWSPGGHFLVAAFQQNTGKDADRLYLFDINGNNKLLLEGYLHVAGWSPDGRTLALNAWDGPQGEQFITGDIWLAELADKDISLPAKIPSAETVPISQLPIPSVKMTPEDVIRNYWESINKHDYLNAWALRTTSERARNGLKMFSKAWQCVESAKIKDLHVGIGNENEKMIFVNVETKVKPDCEREEWIWGHIGPFTKVVRETPNGPWLVDSFNSGP